MPFITPSSASAFFNQIKNHPNPAKFLENLITDPIGESEILDYKGAADPTMTREGIRGIWSKALSCFANSGGGVLIWGIDARKNIPKSLSLVRDVHDLRSKLLHDLPMATEVPVQGVEVEAVPQRSDMPQGFVVCLIPPSPWRPHRSRWPKEEYFIRAGDNCVPAPHSILRILFYPANVAALEIHGQAQCVPHVKNQQLIRFSCWLYNAGPSSAYDVFLVIRLSRGITYPSPGKFWTASQRGQAGLAISASRPVHPLETALIFKEEIGLVVNDRYELKTGELEFRFSVSYKDQPRQDYCLFLSEREIKQQQVVHARVES